MFKKSFHIALVASIAVFLFTACKKDSQINPPVAAKPIEVILPTPITDNIYPNPCISTFTIETNSTDSQTVVMYDVMGRTVLSLTIKGTTAIVVGNNITNGIYLLEMTTKTGIIKKRLVVER